MKRDNSSKGKSRQASANRVTALIKRLFPDYGMFLMLVDYDDAEHNHDGSVSRYWTTNIGCENCLSKFLTDTADQIKKEGELKGEKGAAKRAA